MMSFLPSQKNHPIRFGRVYCHWPLLVQTFLPWAARQQLLQAFHWFSQSPCGNFHPWHHELFLRCVHRGKFWIYPAIFGERKFELTENRTFMRIRHVDTEILEINAPQTNITHSICSKFPGPEDPEEAAPSHVSAMRRLLTVVLIGKTGAKASNDDAKRATDAINRYGDMMKKTSLWCATESNAGCDERSNGSDHALFSMKCHCREKPKIRKPLTENPWRHGNLSFYRHHVLIIQSICTVKISKLLSAFKFQWTAHSFFALVPTLDGQTNTFSWATLARVRPTWPFRLFQNDHGVQHFQGAGRYC